MKLFIQTINKNTISEIENLLEGEKMVLFVSSTNIKLKCIDTLTVSMFSFMSWSRSIDTMKYNKVIFHITASSLGFLYAFHSNKYRRVHLFLHKTINSKQFLFNDNDCDYEIIYISCKHDITKNKTFLKKLERYRSNKIVIYSKSDINLDGFNIIKNGDSMGNKKDMICVVIGKFSRSKYTGYKKVLFFLYENSIIKCHDNMISKHNNCNNDSKDYINCDNNSIINDNISNISSDNNRIINDNISNINSDNNRIINANSSNNNNSNNNSNNNNSNNNNSNNNNSNNNNSNNNNSNNNNSNNNNNNTNTYNASISNDNNNNSNNNNNNNNTNNNNSNNNNNNTNTYNASISNDNNNNSNNNNNNNTNNNNDNNNDNNNTYNASISNDNNYNEVCNSRVIIRTISTNKNINFYSGMKLCSFGETSIPERNCYQSLLIILNMFKSEMEKEVFLFIKSIGCTWAHIGVTSYLTIEFFKFNTESEPFVKKAERINNCAFKAIIWMYERRFIDGNCRVNIKEVIQMDIVNNLLMRAYGTSDFNEIVKIKNEFMAQNVNDMRENTLTVCICPGNDNLYPEVEENIYEKNFKKRYMVDPGDLKATTPYERLVNKGDDVLLWYETVYHKVPKNLQDYTEELCLYAFNNSNIGILSGKSFERFKYEEKSMDIWMVCSIKLKEREIFMLKLFQVIFFLSANLSLYQTKKQNLRLYYYAVPLTLAKDGIDWEFLEKIFNNLIVSVLPDNECFKPNNLLWNPYENVFMVWKGNSPVRIDCKIANSEMTCFEYFHDIYNIKLRTREGFCMLKYFLLEKEGSRINRKLEKAKAAGKVVTSANLTNFLKIGGNSDTEDQNTSCEIINGRNNIINDLHSGDNSNKGNIKTFISNNTLNNNSNDLHSGDNSNKGNIKTFISNNTLNNNSNDFVNFEANHLNGLKHINSSIPVNPKAVTSYLLFPKEIAFVTNINTSIICESLIFKQNFGYFESASVYHEFMELFSLNVPLDRLYIAFTSRAIDEKNNYERIEFLGDCVLKFIVSVYLFLEGHVLGDIVKIKSKIVSNYNLNRIFIDRKIYRYIAMRKYNTKMFQAPFASNFNAFNRFFKSRNMFTSDNRLMYLCTENNAVFNPNINKKVYADILEAIVGIIYLYGDLPESIRFLYNIGLLPRPSNINSSNLDSKKCFDPNINLNKSAEKATSVVNKYLYDSLDENLKFKKFENEFERNIINVLGKDFENVFKEKNISKTVENPLHNKDNSKSKIMENPLHNKDEFLKPEDIIETSKTYPFPYSIPDIPAYMGIITLEDSIQLEKITGYKFNDINILEKALVLPEHMNNLFGSNYFQTLELIGDAALDLFIVKKIYNDTKNISAEDLHIEKMVYVSNNLLGKIAIETGIINYVKFNENRNDFIHSDNYSKAGEEKLKNKKIYGDIFEALLGAILYDLKFDYNEFEAIINRRLWKTIIKFSKSKNFTKNNSNKNDN